MIEVEIINHHGNGRHIWLLGRIEGLVGFEILVILIVLFLGWEIGFCRYILKHINLLYNL